MQANILASAKITKPHSPQTIHGGSAKSILWGGLVSGALSLAAALAFGCIQGTRISVVLQCIASGLLSDIAFMGGSFTAAVGVAVHFAIAFGVATVYCLFARKLPFITRHPFIVGPLYGVMIYLVITMVIIPLSAFPAVLLQDLHLTSLGPNLVIGLLIHMLLIGNLIALAAAHFLEDPLKSRITFDRSLA